MNEDHYILSVIAILIRKKGIRFARVLLSTSHNRLKYLHIQKPVRIFSAWASAHLISARQAMLDAFFVSPKKSSTHFKMWYFLLEIYLKNQQSLSHTQTALKVKWEWNRGWAWTSCTGFILGFSSWNRCYFIKTSVTPFPGSCWHFCWLCCT